MMNYSSNQGSQKSISTANSIAIVNITAIRAYGSLQRTSGVCTSLPVLIP